MSERKPGETREELAQALTEAGRTIAMIQQTLAEIGQEDGEDIEQEAAAKITDSLDLLDEAIAVLKQEGEA